MKRLTRSIAAGMALAAVSAAQAADLSPPTWPSAQRARLERLAMSPFPPAARTVDGRTELVSATLSPEAVHAGMEALRQGGTAADAAVTVALTQVATSLGSVVSYAGVAEVLYYDAASGRIHVLDAGWAAYAGETDPASIPAIDLSALGGRGGGESAEQGRKTLVPGFMAGMEALHGRFGKLPFKDLFQPAIWYAEEGVTVSPMLAGFFSGQQRYLSRTAEGLRFLGQAGGSLPKEGDRFVQPDLAEVLRAVADRGAQVMYGGEWGRAYVAAVRAEGGKAAIEDMQAYRAVWSEPLSTRFAGATVYGPDASNSSSCRILEALNLLDAQPQSAASYWTDPTAFQAYATTLRFATYAHYSPGVAAFERQAGFASTCAARLSPEYGKAVVAHMDELISRPIAGPEPGHHSNAVVVVDRFGNVAALVHSINTVTWGDTGIVVGGIPVSNAGGLYKSRMVNLPVSRRIPGDMAPVIAMRDGKPVLAIATIGSSLTPETVRLAAGALRGADLPALAAAPPLLNNTDPYVATQALSQRAERMPIRDYPPALIAALRERGMVLGPAPPAVTDALRGTAALVVIDPANGAMVAVETPRVMTFADGR